MNELRLDDTIGRLTLADAMLGELMTDVLRVLAEANYPGASGEVRDGQTTRQATVRLKRYMHDENALFPRRAWAWVDQIIAALDLRDHIVHAVALDQCMSCGGVKNFSHPRSGSTVDRSSDTVATLTQKLELLRRHGLVLAIEVSEKVNERIVRVAKGGSGSHGTGAEPATSSPQPG